MDSVIGIITILGFLLQVIVIAVGGVWVVAKIQSATEKLSISIQHLTKTIDAQKEWLRALDEKVNGHSERIAIIESQNQKK